jgi:hypothetical protein
MEEEKIVTEGETGKKKRVLTPEHLAKMKEARIRGLAARKGKKAKDKPEVVKEPELNNVKTEVIVSKKDLKFFGEGDKGKNGKIASEYPAWTFKAQIEELEENVSKMEGRVARGIVPTSELPYATKAIQREKDKLDRINESHGEVKGHEDTLDKCQKELGGIIREAMYTRTDGEKGLADPHEVADRWSKPCISLPQDARALAAKANIPMTSDGKVTQIGAEKLWKLCRAGLGESANTEILRRG